MKNLWQKRRELFKRLYIRGTKNEKSTEDEVLVVNSSSGQGFEKIRIYGKTTYTPVDFSSLLMSVASKKESYTSTGTTGVLCCGIPDLLCQRELTYTPTLTGDIGTHSVYIADGYNFLFSSTHTLINGGTCYPVKIKDYPYIIITGIVDEAGLDSVLACFTISVEGDTVYEIKSLENPLVELYGKNLTNMEDDKYSGAGKILEKSSSHIKLESRHTHHSANMKLAIDGQRINERNVIVSCEFSISTDQVTSLAGITWFTNGGISISNKMIGAQSKVGVTEGKISLNRVLNADLSKIDTTKSALCFAFFSNANGKTTYDPTTITYKYPMLRLPGTDEDFEEYREPVKIQVSDITLASVGNVRDYLEIDKKDGRVTYHKLVGTLDINKSKGDQAVLENEEIQDFSDTEWAKSLLELNVPYGCDGYLWVEGSGGIDCEYYTIKNESKYVLTVYYEDQEKNQLEAQKIYHVRRGSVYKIIPPHLSGYVAISDTKTGVINQNTEITLIYKKEEV